MDWTESCSQFKSSGDVSVLNGLLLDLLMDHLDGKCDATQILNELYREENCREVIQDCLLDVLWLFDLESTDASGNVNASTSSLLFASAPGSPKSVSSEQLSQFSDTAILAKKLFEMGFIQLAAALERLEAGLLEAMGIVASAELFNKKLVKLNTGMFYRQQKYNLLREESEGFARLLILLAESGDPQVVLERVLVMIGTFDLDPIRVLDLILDEFTFHFRRELFVPLLKSLGFLKSTLLGVLGFKLEFAASEESRKLGQDYLEALFRMVACLLEEGLVEITSLYPLLSPSDDECKAKFETFNAELIKAASQMGVVNLASSADKNDTQVDSLTKSLQPESLSEQFAADAFNKKLAELYPFSNQKTRLVVALLEAGNAEAAGIILQSMPVLVSLHARLPQLVSKVPSLQHLLQAGQLACNPELFAQICRGNPSKEVVLNSLLPALLLSGNNALLFSQELWQVIKDYPYTERYSLYASWSSMSSPPITFAKASATAEARKVIRRLAKETVRQYGRLVAKVTHAAPHVTIPLIIGQLQVYDNLIPSVVEAFKFLTPLSFDVLMWSLLSGIASSERDRLKEDGVNVADWLQNSARFIASLIRRHYSSVDAGPLLRFIYAQLCDDNGLDVILLQELLTLVAGIERPENDSEASLEARFGGPVLQTFIEETAQVSSKPHRRAFSKLKAALEAEELARPLLIALAQAADAAVYRMDYEHLKLTASLVDTLQSTLVQYLRFLSTAGSQIDLDLAELTGEFKLTKATSLFLMKSLGKQVDLENGFLNAFWNLSALRIPTARYALEISKAPAETKTKLEQELSELKEQREQEQTKLTEKSYDADLETILEHGLWPRLSSSPVDALLAADFIFFAHEHELVKNVSTVDLIDAIFNLPESSLPYMTEMEAACFGRFMQECLLKLQEWHGNQALFESQARHKAGFFQEKRPEPADEGTADGITSDASAESSVEDGEIGDEGDQEVEEIVESTANLMQVDAVPEEPYLTWQDYRHCLFDWHQKLFEAISRCLTTSDFTSIRNAIIFSSRLQGTFPRLEKHSKQLEEAILALKEHDKREDIKVLATRYSALIIQNRSILVKESHFHQCEVEEEEDVQEAVPQKSQKSSPLKRSASEMEVDSETVSKRSRNDDRSYSRPRTSTSTYSRSSRNERSDRDRDSRSSRETSIRHSSHSRDTRDSRDTRGSRDSRDTRDLRDSRDSRDGRDRRDGRDYRESRDSRSSHHSRSHGSSGRRY